MADKTLPVTFLCAVSDGSYELQRPKKCFILSAVPGSFGERILLDRGLREMTLLFWWDDDPDFRPNEFYPSQPGIYQWDSHATYDKDSSRYLFSNGQFRPVAVPRAEWWEEL